MATWNKNVMRSNSFTCANDTFQCITLAVCWSVVREEGVNVVLSFRKTVVLFLYLDALNLFMEGEGDGVKKWEGCAATAVQLIKELKSSLLVPHILQLARSPETQALLSSNHIL
jgi:hypothetical protein